MVTRTKFQPRGMESIDVYEERGKVFSTYYLSTGDGKEKLPTYLTAFLDMLNDRGEDIVSVLPDAASPDFRRGGVLNVATNFDISMNAVYLHGVVVVSKYRPKH